MKGRMHYCIVERQCNRPANPFFQTDILRVRVPNDGILLPACTKRPRKLAVSADLLCGAGCYLRLVCSGRTLAVCTSGKYENSLCESISVLSGVTIVWICHNARFHRCNGPCIIHVHLHGSKASPSVQPREGHHLFLPDLLCDLGDLYSDLHRLE